MKKVFLMLAFALAMSGANAQENKKQTYELGCNIGMTTFTNYSSLSLFQDAMDSYTTLSEAIHFGVRRGNTLLGLQFQAAIYNTSALAVNEGVAWTDFSLMGRRYIDIANNWETFLGLKFGFSVMTNTFEYLNEKYSRTRLGLTGEFEIGLNYRFDDGNYIGLRAAFHVPGGHFKKDLELPAGLVENDKRTLGGYSLMMQYGFSF